MRPWSIGMNTRALAAYPRDKPDWIYLQGWGAMNPTAVKEAARAQIPKVSRNSSFTSGMPLSISS